MCFVEVACDTERCIVRNIPLAVIGDGVQSGIQQIPMAESLCCRGGWADTASPEAQPDLSVG